MTLAILMMLINVPLFIYSVSLTHRSGSIHAPEMVESSPASSPHEESHDPHAAKELPSKEAEDAAGQLNADSSSMATAEEDKPERAHTLANLYRPPLFGKCKKLFERFNRKSFADKPYKAFVYSFDGEQAYCADAYTDKGQQAAEEIVMRDCEEHHAGSGKYSPCRIYPPE